ncbi:MAG: methylenetetrahydrofolate reductase [NAD(P)H] [Phycisphaerales bacterium]|nr:methylenetetrahydrofolate reductase [NAD(P)H] [Phycisphaerales bacterium]
MHIEDIFKLRSTTFSFEFFPPKSKAGAEELFEEIKHLEPLAPSFVSVTYGAGGGTRELTHELVMRIKRQTGLDPTPHLTCIYHTEAEIYDILERYAEAGISNILALSGDPPRDKPDYDRSKDSFRYASQLVRFIRQFKDRHAGRAIKDRRGFGIAVAGFPEGHPATPNRLREMDHLKAKVDEGADFIVTQLFFDNRDFYDFRERCDLAGVKVPIIAGVMPITSDQGMHRMADLAAGARFPAALLRAVQRCKGNQDAVRRVGIHWATEQCRDLLDHQVRGIHLYTLNRSTATREIYANLGVQDSLALA